MNIAKLFSSIIFCLLTAAVIVAQPGSLDASFGNSGKVVGGVLNDTEDSLAVQPDGKIVVAGTANSKFTVFRYNSNGTLDTAFGIKGSVAIDFYAGIASGASAIVVQPDGKIIAAGLTNSLVFSPVNQSEFAIARFNADGSLDTAFGSGGKIITDVASIDKVKDIVVQPDGKIILTGDGLQRQGSGIYRGTSIFAIRYNSDGSLDTAFGNGGTASASFEILSNPPVSGSHTSESLAIQPDGKIVVVGTAAVVSSTGGFVGGAAVARFLPNGQLDTSFDTDGKAFTAIFDSQNTQYAYQIKSVAIQPDGKIVVAGSIGSNNNTFPYDFVVFRYTATGSLDTSFDGDGKVVSSIEAGNDFARDVLIQPNGKIIAVGESAAGTDRNFAVARYNADGSFDNSFDGDGKAITDFGGGSADFISRAVLQPDGKILVAGTANTNLALARYIGDAIAVTPTKFDFDGDGKADLSVFRPDNSVWYLQQSANGFSGVQFGISTDKIVPADYDGDGKTDLAVVRNGTWYLQRSSAGFYTVTFGLADDIFVPADYDGDGKADLAVFRPSNATWYLLRSNLGYTTVQFGISTDKPVPADYNGDGSADVALFRPSNGTWYTSTNPMTNYGAVQFGDANDKLVPADYDADGKADVAVFRPSNGTWYLNRSQLGFTAIAFGTGTDLPTPADYDGDGKADIAVFRNGTWYLQRSAAGFTVVPFGTTGDKPIPNAYVP